MHGKPSSSASPLRDRTYRRLFAAQVIALLGTGLSTVALSLLAYDLAGDDAGVVLGVALALKMVAYVVVAPVVAGFLQRVERRRLLVSLDLARAACVLVMPFVTQVWQVFVLILVLNACSAGFTPTFQAAIPDVLPDEERYTRALSLSRVAYELENLLSPALAAVALLAVSFHALFAVNGVAFLCSASLVLSVTLPAAAPAVRSTVGSVAERLSFGTRRYLRVPCLRALLALNLAVAAAGAMVIVNTVVLVRGDFGRDSEVDVALALGAAGVGSMLAALLLPRILSRLGDRATVLTGGALLPVGLLATAALPSYAALLAVWAVLGVGLALVETPAGRLVQHSVGDGDGQALFAAQFSLSHACWLLTYPIAGVLGAVLGLDVVAVILAGIAALASAGAVLLWAGPPVPGRLPRHRPGARRA
ncbi:MFS transporter [Patulibacter sp.]|uniref:MFS transporter n=1 Tax=Patulibacter sp. TaxID=1912859 RepID=UPI002724E8E2|nr:MFS transporter [Patulibacter sp.]MDO9408160.1 MFS transporter [Patulibacter sp.]